MVHVYGWSVRFMWVIRGESVCQGWVQAFITVLEA